MADKKVSELSAITNASGDDLLLVVNDPSGTPTSNKLTINNLFANVVPTTTHKGRVTFKANTNYTGTKATFAANVTVSGTLNVTGSKGIQIDGTTMLGGNGKLHANNTITTGTITDAMLATDYTTIANVTSTFQTKADAIATNNALLVLINNANPAFTSVDADIIYAANISATSVQLSGDLVSTANITAVNISTSNLISEGVYTSNLHIQTLDFEPKPDPVTSNAVTEGILQGEIFFSNTHLYIAVSNNTIKRITLTDF